MKGYAKELRDLNLIEFQQPHADIFHKWVNDYQDIISVSIAAKMPTLFMLARKWSAEQRKSRQLERMGWWFLQKEKIHILQMGKLFCKSCETNSKERWLVKGNNIIFFLI